MDEKIYFLCEELKKEMDNDPRFVKVKELEEKMNSNEEVMLLAYRKDCASDKYSDSLKIYDDNHPVVIAVRKELLEAKKALDNHPLVKEYLEAYQEIRMLLLEVNDILFGDLKGEKH